MKNKTCGECKHYIAEMFHCQKNDVMAESFNTCEDFEQKFITNGDKIRQMSDRELASFLSSKTICPVCPAQTEKCIGNADKVCIKNWLAYLNAPAERKVEDE